MPEKIGEGLQYKVYDIGSNRVKKVPKSRLEMSIQLLDWYPSYALRPWKILSKVEQSIDRRERAEARLDEDRYRELSILGNLNFRDDAIYQERAVPVEEVLRDAEFEEKREVVDDYIDLLHELWSRGIGDTIYNFTENSGYVGDEMVQMDIGELVFSKEEVADAVRSQKWLGQWIYQECLEPDTREYFRERMSEEVTLKILEEKWERNI